MRLVLPVAIVAAALALPASAQDSKAKSQTEIKADDAKVISMTGCLRNDTAGSGYVLEGTMAAIGDDLKTKSTVKTDVGDDKTTVKGKTETKADDGAVVGTSGVVSRYTLIPGRNVNLTPHVGERVQVNTVVVEAGRGDADVKIKEETKVEPAGAPDSSSQSKTKVELPKSQAGQYTVMAITTLAGTCTQ